MRRVAAVSCPSPCGVLASRAVAFSEENSALAAVAASRRWSNVWVAEDELSWLGLELAAPDEPGSGTVATVPRRLEFHNADAFAPHALLAALPPRPTRHTSVATRQPFHAAMGAALDAAARERGWRSRYWVASSLVGWHGLCLRPLSPAPEPPRTSGSATQALPSCVASAIPSADEGGRPRPPPSLSLPASRRVRMPLPVALRCEFRATLFNASQLADPQRLLTLPVRGGTKRVFVDSFRAPLAAAVAANGWRCGLYFSPGDLAALELSARLDCSPVRVPIEGCGDGEEWFNVADIADGETVLAALGRSGAPDEPASLFSGRSVQDPALAAALAAAAVADGRALNYWARRADLAMHGLALRDGARDGVRGAPSTARVFSFFNVDQLEAPLLGFQRAGSRGVV